MPSDHLITDLATCGLTAASFIRLEIFTLDNRILQRRIGQLGEADRSVLRTALAELCPARPEAFAAFTQPDRRPPL